MFIVKPFKKVLQYFGFYKSRIRVLFAGLDNAGKTTIIHQLKGEHLFVCEPGRRCQIEQNIEIDGVHITINDAAVPFHRKEAYQNYLDQTDAIVYVIDANDVKRMMEAKNELQKLLEHQFPKSTVYSQLPILILGNKIDMQMALTQDEFEERLELSSINKQNFPIRIQMCSAMKKQTLFEGMRWLTNQIP